MDRRIRTLVGMGHRHVSLDPVAHLLDPLGPMGSSADAAALVDRSRIKRDSLETRRSPSLRDPGFSRLMLLD
jgi:hypothetical protein